MVKALPVVNGLEMVKLNLSKDVVIKAEPNTEVKTGSVIGEKRAEQIEYDLVKLIKINPKKIKDKVKFQAGDLVKKGDLLAEKKGWLKSQKVISQVNGKVLSADEGKLVIETEDRGEQILSPLTGKVAGLAEGLIDIEISGEVVDGAVAWGEKNWGRLWVLEPGEDGELSLESVRGDLQDKVVVVGAGLQKGLWYKLCALGVRGVVCPSVPANFSDWVDVEGDEDGLGKLKQAVLVINEVDTNQQTAEQQFDKEEQQTKPDANLNNESSGFTPNQSQGHGSGFTPELWSWFNKGVGKVAVINVGEKKLLISNE